MLSGELIDEADYFSTHLAIDDGELKSDNFESMTVEQISAQLHVPIDLLKLKLDSVRLNCVK